MLVVMGSGTCWSHLHTKLKGTIHSDKMDKKLLHSTLGSIFGGFLTSIAYAMSVDVTVGGFRTLSLPGVFPIASVVGGLVGLAVTPFVHASLRDRSLAKTLPVIYSVVCSCTIVLNVMSQGRGLGLPGAFLALFVMLQRYSRSTGRT
jgi:hypothetical protein